MHPLWKCYYREFTWKIANDIIKVGEKCRTFEKALSNHWLLFSVQSHSVISNFPYELPIADYDTWLCSFKLHQSAAFTDGRRHYIRWPIMRACNFIRKICADEGAKHEEPKTRRQVSRGENRNGRNWRACEHADLRSSTTQVGDQRTLACSPVLFALRPCGLGFLVSGKLSNALAPRIFRGLWYWWKNLRTPRGNDGVHARVRESREREFSRITAAKPVESLQRLKTDLGNSSSGSDGYFEALSPE